MSFARSSLPYLLLFPIDQNPLTPRYTIDFDPQLNEMMTEARYLEQFDYALPESIRHLALSVSPLIFHCSSRNCLDFSGGENETIIHSIENCAEKLSSTD